MNFEHHRLLAIKSVALKDDSYIYRMVCRYYSESFHTPLKQVYELPWNHIVQNYLESHLEKKDKSELYDIVIEAAYPEKAMENESALEDQIKMWEAKETEKQKRKENKQKIEQKSKIEDDKKENTKESRDIKVSHFDHLDKEMEEE